MKYQQFRMAICSTYFIPLTHTYRLVQRMRSHTSILASYLWSYLTWFGIPILQNTQDPSRSPSCCFRPWYECSEPTVNWPSVVLVCHGWVDAIVQCSWTLGHPRTFLAQAAKKEIYLTACFEPPRLRYLFQVVQRQTTTAYWRILPILLYTLKLGWKNKHNATNRPF